MSSLLKALKQQQSPLLTQTSILDASLMASDKKHRSWSWLIWPAVLIAGLALGAGIARWVEKDPGADVLAAERFSWGKTNDVETVSWEAAPEEETPQIVQSGRQAEGFQAETPGELQRSQPEPAKAPREALDLSSVSPDLLQRFEAAVNEVSGNDNSESDTSVVPPLGELSRSFQQQVPAFSYDSHMYRSRPSQRWIELNGRRLYEGDTLNQLAILRIEPQKVILVMDSQAFSQAALEDWQPY